MKRITLSLISAVVLGVAPPVFAGGGGSSPTVDADAEAEANAAAIGIGGTNSLQLRQEGATPIFAPNAGGALPSLPQYFIAPAPQGIAGTEQGNNLQDFWTDMCERQGGVSDGAIKEIGMSIIGFASRYNPESVPRPLRDSYSHPAIRIVSSLPKGKYWQCVGFVKVVQNMEQNPEMAMDAFMHGDLRTFFGTYPGLAGLQSVLVFRPPGMSATSVGSQSEAGGFSLSPQFSGLMSGLFGGAIGHYAHTRGNVLPEERREFMAIVVSETTQWAGVPLDPDTWMELRRSKPSPQPIGGNGTKAEALKQ